ncbi:MAG: hypothetical protein WAV20_13725, partial [Blastocatellia bacterium]
NIMAEKLVAHVPARNKHGLVSREKDVSLKLQVVSLQHRNRIQSSAPARIMQHQTHWSKSA